MVVEIIVILEIILKYVYIYLSFLKASESEFRVIIIFSLSFILKYSDLRSRRWRYN